MLSGTALLLATLVPCGVVVASEDLIANESRNFSEASRAARQKAPAPTLKLLAGGQGTTATHAMFTIMCDAGLTACHYKQCCNAEDLPEIAKANARFIALYRLVPVCINNDEESLRRFCGFTDDLQGYQGGPDVPVFCSQRHLRGGCCRKLINETNPLMIEAMAEALHGFGCSLDKYMASLHDVVRGVMTSGVEALVDVPTASFLPTFRAVAPDHPLRLIMTTREPTTWATKRIEEHGAADFMCAIDNGGGRRLADMEGCMKAVVDQSRGDRPLLLSDAFQSLPNTTHDERRDVIQSLQDALAPELAQRMAAPGSPVPESRYGPWFMEIDFFDRTINRVEVEALEDPGADDDEEDVRRVFLEEAEEAFRSWWGVPKLESKER